jgi:hypothetical protein
MHFKYIIIKCKYVLYPSPPFPSPAPHVDLSISAEGHGVPPTSGNVGNSNLLKVNHLQTGRQQQQLNSGKSSDQLKQLNQENT